MQHSTKNMWKLIALVLIGLLPLVGCDAEDTEVTEDTGAMEDMEIMDDSEAEYQVALSGENEVAPVETEATGEAVFTVNEADSTVSYTLSAANIENVTQAHIHQGGAEENGPPIAPLFNAEGDPVTAEESTEIASGTLTADDLMGPLEGGSFQELVQAMQQGEAFVNVHTEANPAGEIRGQINNGGSAGTDNGGLQE